MTLPTIAVVDSTTKTTSVWQKIQRKIPFGVNAECARGL